MTTSVLDVDSQVAQTFRERSNLRAQIRSVAARLGITENQLIFSMGLQGTFEQATSLTALNNRPVKLQEISSQEVRVRLDEEGGYVCVGRIELLDARARSLFGNVEIWVVEPWCGFACTERFITATEAVDALIHIYRDHVRGNHADLCKYSTRTAITVTPNAWVDRKLECGRQLRKVRLADRELVPE